MRGTPRVFVLVVAVLGAFVVPGTALGAPPPPSASAELEGDSLVVGYRLPKGAQYTVVAVADVRYTVTCTSDGTPPTNVSGAGDVGDVSGLALSYEVETLESGGAQTSGGTLESEPASARQGTLVIAGPSRFCADTDHVIEEIVTYTNVRVENRLYGDTVSSTPAPGAWEYVYPQ
jgi:hypothetical protein